MNIEQLSNMTGGGQDDQWQNWQVAKMTNAKYDWWRWTRWPGPTAKYDWWPNWHKYDWFLLLGHLDVHRRPKWANDCRRQAIEESPQQLRLSKDLCADARTKDKAQKGRTDGGGAMRVGVRSSDRQDRPPLAQVHHWQNFLLHLRDEGGQILVKPKH